MVDTIKLNERVVFGIGNIDRGVIYIRNRDLFIKTSKIDCKCFCILVQMLGRPVALTSQFSA